MKLKDLFIPYLDMSYEERTKYIENLRIRRIPPVEIKKSRKKKVELTLEEQALIDKILKGLK